MLLPVSDYHGVLSKKNEFIENWRGKNIQNKTIIKKKRNCWEKTSASKEIQKTPTLSTERYLGFDLMTPDSYFMTLIGVFTNHVLAEHIILMNHIEWTEHKIVV